ncbi:MAG: Arabinose 5-phosphate isomerase KdsD [Candidatus Accumulibacter regalis]|jgi:CBS domain-containing protein|uniref:Arabinose 5-phosphate isomerase KdsD n=1 Tax=Accumulibacter regalis TaxID=522306 RepID=A0A011RJI2_ACCRE|nr:MULTISPECIES: CBS domain-containing protein [unclassified Candidatus Accumulibacter]EXI91334.1 MAG: Arabinose 5-phosphate isomerase KdsD [Candidatus Accumulibacter regalis]MQM35714.1 CBS domain-containing protein [Candidatus Accumulibacter phosphatis]MBL8369426.1 CBS domain-containing protein [Accumulibacter sp.]MBN8515253.1 CBS domain-containing protein [Accumulibacter sp.]MBO3701332.1 CBS domain-containing protein [Accumulibacter sp.]
MKTLKQILDSKGGVLATVAPDDSVFKALQVMAERNVGAVLVVDQNRLLGIFSERDYARKVSLLDKSSRDTQVCEIMSNKVLYVTPDQTVDECMAIMTERHFRHLPVLNEQHELLGIVSIGDVVKETISEQQFIIQQMEKYIAG